jgi:cobalamin biosynthesis Co2+ chelatase CbiK
MRKQILEMVCAAALTGALLAGCGSASSVGSTAKDAESEAAKTVQSESSAVSAADQEAADHVAALIDAIYVQERTDQTDEQCKEAKEAWDALTDAQKELVSGNFADPDYFGLDTGDASKDDPLNSDDIGEKELLVVSFGTSYNDSRTEDVGGIEKALIMAYPDWSVRRAFTSQIIINHVAARDGEMIDNVEQALDRAVKNGVKELVVQPTHLMHGYEYDDLVAAVKDEENKFTSVKVAEPLLGEVGANAEDVNADKQAVSEAVVTESMKDAGFKDAEEAAEKGTALVLMGHGTSHTASVTYSQMQTQMDSLGYTNVFVGTVEGKPEGTDAASIAEKVKTAGYKSVILRPLMVVAGDHANNDMAGDEEDSWKSIFKASGAFTNIDSQIEGLGSISAIQQMYVEHTAAVIGDESQNAAGEAASEAASASLSDGTYTADFTTDSSMFHVNDADNGKGTLTVKNGMMTIHIRLTSTNIVNLFAGTAADAQKEGAALLMPAKETVTYEDGTTEEVNSFDVPVASLGEEFDLALLGTKGKWYDHKVTVADPVPAE